MLKGQLDKKTEEVNTQNTKEVQLQELLGAGEKKLNNMRLVVLLKLWVCYNSSDVHSLKSAKNR